MPKIPDNISCLYQCKDTKFLANHNMDCDKQHRAEVVYTNAKIRNF